jgi:pimeloyl-ACP methyl ester carboxylesterase
MSNQDIIQSDNFIIGYNEQKPIVADITYDRSASQHPVVIFCHGYKGFKDWGAWNLVAKRFAEAGYLFLKFNFSHNGGTFEQPIDFPDLEAFAEDNFSKQLDDLEQVIDFVVNQKSPLPSVNTSNISLIGHSRGGGITCIKTAENKHISKLITWAAVSDFESRLPQDEALTEWKQNGVYYVKNGRTKQDMPHKIQFYEDFETHKDRFDILEKTKQITCPLLIIHGKNDETVSTEDAHALHNACSHSELRLITNAGHTFNTCHPWKVSKLNREMNEVVNLCFAFLKS